MRRGDWRGGRREEGLQLEVSEWTLPGPSVGDVTDEGVGASCQPPFVCGDETARRVRVTRTVGNRYGLTGAGAAPRPKHAQRSKPMLLPLSQRCA